MIKLIISFLKSKLLPLHKQAQKAGVILGKNVIVGSKFWSSEPYLITIGDNVQITTGVKIFTHGASHVYRNIYNSKFDTFGKVSIGNNVYIGTNALIMPGVIIEDNVIIGAGSIVTKSIPANSIIGGNPAMIIGKIEDGFSKISDNNFDTFGMTFEEKRDVLLKATDKKFIIKNYLNK